MARSDSSAAGIACANRSARSLVAVHAHAVPLIAWTLETTTMRPIPRHGSKATSVGTDAAAPASTQAQRPVPPETRTGRQYPVASRSTLRVTDALPPGLTGFGRGRPGADADPDSAPRFALRIKRSTAAAEAAGLSRPGSPTTRHLDLLADAEVAHINRHLPDPPDGGQAGAARGSKRPRPDATPSAASGEDATPSPERPRFGKTPP